MVNSFGKEVGFEPLHSLRGFLLAPDKLALSTLRQAVVLDYVNQRLERASLSQTVSPERQAVTDANEQQPVRLPQHRHRRNLDMTGSD